MDPRSRGFTPAQSYPARPYDYDPLPYPTPPSVGTIHSLPPAPAALDSPGYHSYLHHHSNAPPLVLHHGNPEQQKIKTLFISGLPDDVKAREIHNLFRHHRGFSSCQLKYTGRGNEVVAFAMFINHQSAIAALGALNGTVFDPETRAVIHIELARSNSRKRPRGGAAYWIIDKRTKLHKEATEEWSDEGDGGSDEPSGTENDSPSNKRALAASRSVESESKRANGQAARHSDKASGDIPPCSTLFIANLGPTCTEAELKEVLTKYAGFHTLKMRGRGGMPVAFADFQDVESSTAAMNALQSTSLESSDRGGLHIEYARSKMRKN